MSILALKTLATAFLCFGVLTLIVGLNSHYQKVSVDPIKRDIHLNMEGAMRMGYTCKQAGIPLDVCLNQIPTLMKYQH